MTLAAHVHILVYLWVVSTKQMITWHFVKPEAPTGSQR